jgi:DNA-3-methyladenine glycosylase II
MSDYTLARRHLMRRDPVLGELIRRIGPCGLAGRLRNDHLGALTAAIVSQQLSTKAAATIHRRFLALFPGGTPDAGAIAALDDGTLRGVGLSSQKLRYMRDLCAHVLDGRLQLDRLSSLSDDEVIEQLTAVTGFGRWSAEMYLIFRLNRPDVLPVADLGIATAIQRVYRLKQRPDSTRILKIGEPWRPFRSVACWYLWQSLQQDGV